MKTSRFEAKENISSNEESHSNEATVPPAVIRSLKNIRRDVVVDMEGRNSVLR